MFKTFIAFIAAASMLTACNSNEAHKDNNESTPKNEEVLQTENIQEERQENEQPTEQAQNQSAESVNHEEWSSLPEYNKIIEQIGDKDNRFQTVTDNEGKRILLIKDENGEEQYKTIFIKNTSRLKIIKVNGGGQIFNGTLAQS
ncbi:hypothetical protein [Bacillus sp. PK3_68]|uniref:hypothetical protein n=1 Tax=Bacillaceae TaxID=186817 RepID=UPI000E74EB6B|nr:hypothetical protein [Bacillus sp. PK3_68]RJS50229.1 hypothetical protein CJ483_23655 [Bacillus sp. PK3_68]